MKRWYLYLLLLGLAFLSITVTILVFPDLNFQIQNLWSSDNSERIRLIDNALGQENYSKVREELDSILELNLTSADLLNLIRIAVFLPEEEGRLPYLEKTTKAAWEKGPEGEYLAALRAYSLMRSGEYILALELANKYVRSPRWDDLVLEITLSAELGHPPFGEQGMQDLRFDDLINEPPTRRLAYQVLVDVLEDPEDQIILNHALLELMDGYFDSAVIALRRVRDSLRFGMIKALAFYDMGEYSLAMDAVLSTPNINNSPEALLLLADLSIRLGRWTDSLGYFSQVRELDGGRYATSIVYAKPAYLHLKRKDFAMAEAISRQGIIAFPENIHLWSILLDSLILQGKSIEAQALAETMDNDLIEMMGGMDTATQKVLQMKYFPDSFFNLNQLWQLRSQNPENRYLLEYLAWTLIKEQVFDQALAFFDSIERDILETSSPLEPEYVEWLPYYRGITYALNGQFQEAYESMDEVWTSGRDSYYFYNKAIISAQRGLAAHDETVEAYSQAIANWEYTRQIENNIAFEAQLYAQFAVYLAAHAQVDKDEQDAFRYIQRAIRLQPQDPRIQTWFNQISERKIYDQTQE
jgi:tetratricopeptide (TPR) repeat protein